MVMALRVSAGEGEGGLPLCGVRLGVLAAAISLAQETCPIRAFVAMQVITPTVISVPIHPPFTSNPRRRPKTSRPQPSLTPPAFPGADPRAWALCLRLALTPTAPACLSAASPPRLETLLTLSHACRQPTR